MKINDSINECDVCGEEWDTAKYKGGREIRTETKIEMVVTGLFTNGEQTLFVKICPKCFISKLIPFFQEQMRDPSIFYKRSKGYGILNASDN